jgi:hypothetical protein
MDNHVRVYDNVLTNRTCDNIINLFEQNKEQQVIQNEGSMSFTEISITEHSDWTEYNKQISNALAKGVAKYANDCHIRPQQWPKNHGWESIRIKRYLPNDVDQFDNHVDVMDYDTARRFLVFFIYLNNNDKGQTYVNTKDDMFVSSCKKGSMLIFPPLWPWMHKGAKPINTPKYIAGSYLHYV